MKELFEAKELVVATRNEGKAGEFAALFEPLGVKVHTLNDYPSIPDIVEDGDTFAANARIKAVTVAETLGVPALADDSGLCVDALEGRPGVYSARFAGPEANDAANNALLLEQLGQMAAAGGLSVEPATVDGRPVRLLSDARFVCTLALSVPGRPVVYADGEVKGRIVDTPIGSGGFGYDPLFYVPELGQTMAQLPVASKNAISHRARALARLRELLTQS